MQRVEVNALHPFSSLQDFKIPRLVISLLTMNRLLFCLLFSILLSTAPAISPLEGRWRYDKTRSTALDGWHEWDLVIGVTDKQVSLQHDMKWGKTALSATNVIALGQPS